MRALLYGHIWLSCIAMLLVWECMWLFPGIPQSEYSIYFAGLAVLCVYNLHSLAVLHVRKTFSEFIHWLKKNNKFIWVLTALSFIGSVYILIRYISFCQYAVLGIAVMLWVLYEGYVIKFSYFKQHVLNTSPFLKSIVLAFVWALVTSVVPLSFQGYTILTQPSVWSFLIMRFLTFWLITILFDYRDAPKDRKNNVASMPGRLGSNTTAYVWYLIALSVLTLTYMTGSDSYLFFVKAIQIPLLYFFFRCRNITSFIHSMAFWDGVLILSPLTGLLVSGL